MADGYLTERYGQLAQGIDDLAAGDEIRQTNQLLGILVEEMTDESATSYFEDGFEPTDPGETDDGSNVATYSSREGITAKEATEQIDFGLTANTVVIRNIDDDLAVSFKDPSEHDDAVITVEPSDSPFVLSGVYGIAAAKMWYETASGVEHEFDLLAVKKRGR